MLYKRVRDYYGTPISSDEVVEITEEFYNFYGSYVRFSNIKTGKSGELRKEDFRQQFTPCEEKREKLPEIDVSLMGIDHLQWTSTYTVKLKITPKEGSSSIINIDLKDIKSLIEAAGNYLYLDIKNKIR